MSDINKKEEIILTGSPQWISWILLMGLALIWGSSFILIKYSLFASDGSDLFTWDQVASMRLMFAGLALAPISLKVLRSVERREMSWLLFVGFVGNGIPAFLFTSAQMHLDSGFVGMLNSLTPLFTLLVGVTLFGSKVRLLQITGVLVALTGTVGLIYMQSGIQGGGRVIYALGIVLATICYALSVNVIKSKLKGVRSSVIAAVSLLFVSVPATIYLFTTPALTVLQNHAEGLTGLVYVAILGVVGTAFALILFNKLIDAIGPVFAASVTYLIPFVALGWAVLDKERVIWLHFVLLGVMLTGIYLINLGRAKSA